MQPDADLVDGTLKGDNTAFGELVYRYGQCVMATAWQILRDYHAAQDAAQEVFLTAYQKLGDRSAKYIL
jgi:RNA polymerase sigma-70 factor (ECF subfamily)